MEKTTAVLPAAIEAAGLTKKYGSKTVVHDLTFSVPVGTVCGLVGPNGAGKTTAMAMLLGLVRPSGGQARVLGHDIRRPQSYLRRVGALIEYPAFHPGLSGLGNLQHLARLGGRARDELPGLIDLVGLTGREQDRFATYSLGMKQRLGIAAALIGDPDLVVLDEPTNGVDPQGMKDIRGIIREIAGQGRTVLVSSHLLAELEAVCDHLVVLDRGGCRYAGRLDGLAGTGPHVLTIAADRPAEDLAALVRGAGFAAAATDRGVEIDAGDDEPVTVAARVNALAHANGIVLHRLHHQTITLEERVLDLVSNGASS